MRATKPDGRTTRAEQRRERTRVALITAAHRLMSKRGVEAVSLREITDEADLGAGTFYVHFKSKEEIAARVLDCHIASLVGGLEQSLEQRTLDQPLATIARSVNACLRELSSRRLWLWWLKRPDVLYERLEIGFRRVGHRLVAAAIARHEIPDSDVGASGIWRSIAWQIVGGAIVMVDFRSADDSSPYAVPIIQSLGVPHEEALRLSRLTATGSSAPRPIDFSFVLDERNLEMDWSRAASASPRRN